MRLSKLKVVCEELYASFSSLGIGKVKSIKQFKQSIDTHYPLVSYPALEDDALRSVGKG